MIILFERGRGHAVPRPVVMKGSRNVTGGVGGWGRGRGRLHANSVGSWLVAFYLAVLWLLLLSLRKPPGVFIYTSFNAVVPHSSAPRRGCAAAVPGGQRALQRALSYWIPNAASGKRLSGEPFSLWPEPTASSSHLQQGSPPSARLQRCVRGSCRAGGCERHPRQASASPAGGNRTTRTCAGLAGSGRALVGLANGVLARGSAARAWPLPPPPGPGPCGRWRERGPGSAREGRGRAAPLAAARCLILKAVPWLAGRAEGRGGTWGRSYCLGNRRLPLRARGGGGGGGSAARPSPVAAWGSVLPSSAGAAALAGGVAGDGGGRWPGRWVCAGGRAGEEPWAAGAGHAALWGGRDGAAGHPPAGRAAWRRRGFPSAATAGSFRSLPAPRRRAPQEEGTSRAAARCDTVVAQLLPGAGEGFGSGEGPGAGDRPAAPVRRPAAGRPRASARR